MAQINKPNTHFNTKLYTGDGTTSNSITGVNFKPDLVWIKVRNDTNNFVLYDVVRGANNTLRSSTTGVETNNTDAMSSFNADGFTVGENAFNATNDAGFNFISWNWLAGGTAVSNTQGTIASQVSANQTAGFSIVSWTGTGSAGTIGTGLNATPAMIIVKNRSAVENWRVWHNKLSANDKIVQLNLQDAESSTTDFQPANNTTSVFGIGNNAQSNGSGNSMIAYCFAEKKGFSKFGSYIGTGNSDAPFIYTGFKPAFVLTKNISGANNWTICDNKRNTYNPCDTVLNPNVANIETTNNPQDLVSNGIKNRAIENNTNGSGFTYIYATFADSPLVGTNNIPATAR